MCEDCGCDDIDYGAVHKDEHGHGRDHDHHHDHGREHGHSHEHGPDHPHDHARDHDDNGHSHHTITIAKPVLAANDEYAADNRAFFDRRGLFAINLVSSPGAGKTAVLERLAQRFGDAMAVIEGDIQTRRDADRVIRAGSRARQIETQGACHLDAHAVGHALDDLDLTDCKLLVIENVGNLVCPAAYDLGEHEKVAILSLPEGDDKILKYPAIFSRASVLLINKIDLLPHLRFDTAKAINECRSLNRQVTVFEVSAETGQGLESFGDYLAHRAGIDRPATEPVKGEKR